MPHTCFRIRFALAVILICLAGCDEPCLIPLETTAGTTPRLKAESRITYFASIADSNIRVVQQPPWTERVLTFGATIGDRDSVLATASEEDMSLRFQDIDAQYFYQYLPLVRELDIKLQGFWLKLPLGLDTVIQQIADTSRWGNPITVTYKSYLVDNGSQAIDGKSYAITRIQTDYYWDDIEMNNEIVRHSMRLTTNVSPELGIFTEQTLTYANDRPRTHIIVTKLQF